MFAAHRKPFGIFGLAVLLTSLAVSAVVAFSTGRAFGRENDRPAAAADTAISPAASARAAGPDSPHAPQSTFIDSGQALGGDHSSSAVTLGDVDGDGDLDAVVAQSGVYVNQGGDQGGAEGQFVDGGQDPSAPGAVDVELEDLDGDADLDAFLVKQTLYSYENEVWINQGTATGVFSQTTQMFGDSDTNTTSVALGDLDGVGGPDAFVGHSSGQPSKVWYNDGSATFSDSGQSLDTDSLDLALGDVDGDVDVDAFSANGGSDRVWRNMGGGQGGEPGVFADSGQIMGSSVSNAVALGDVDGDGDLDAYIGKDSADQLWINYGGSQGGTEGVFFYSAQSLSDAQTGDVSLRDLDGDGDLDAFLATVVGNEVWVNQGGDQGGTEGEFVDSGQSLGDSSSQGVALGDVDGDGDLDAFVANYLQPDKVWLNQGAGPAPDVKEWQVQTIATGGSTGVRPSLVLDADGLPHIAYARIEAVDYNPDTGEYRYDRHISYSHWDGVRWHSEPLATSAGFAKFMLALAHDSRGYPHVAYTTDNRVSHLRWDGDQWQESYVPEISNGSFSFALDASDNPHFTYWDFFSAALFYTFFDGTDWQTETVAQGRVDGASLILDDSGSPHVVYCFRGDGVDLRYANKTGGTWSREVVVRSDNDFCFDAWAATLDGDGNPHVAHAADEENLHYAYRNSEGWQSRAVDTTPGSFEGLALAVDGAGYPHLYYADRHRYGNPGTFLNYAIWDGAGWQIENVDYSTYTGSPTHVSMALDGDDTLHAAYREGRYGDLRYVTDAPNWQVRALPEAGTVRAPDLDVQATIPSLTYYNETAGQVKLASWDEAWDLNPLDFISGQGGDVALDAGIVYEHASYYDADNGRLLYGYWDGSAFNMEVVDEAGDVGRYNDLLLVGNSDGLPRIAYWDDTGRRIKVAVPVQNSVTWDIYPNNVGPALDASSGPLSAAVLPGGDIGVAYYDGVNGDLRLAVWDAETTNWTDELVDGATGDAGQLNSLQTDGTDGAPVVVYLAEGEMRMAYKVGDLWTIEDVPADTAGGTVTGLSLELGMNSRQRARIAYTTGDGALQVAFLRDGFWLTEVVESGSLVPGDVSLARDSRLHLGYIGDSGDLRYAFRSATLDVDTSVPDVPPTTFFTGGTYNPLDACQAVLEFLVPTPEAAVTTRLVNRPRAPSSPTEPLSDLAVFRAMAALFDDTSGGQFYIGLYREHGSEMGQLGLDDPALMWDAYGTLHNFMPGLEAMVTGRGDEVLVTQEMVDDALDIWQRLADAGSPELADTINAELAKYNNLQDFVGMSFDEWARALGVATERVYLPVVRDD